MLFGPERSGLENEHIALADTVINGAAQPGFSSLNLAQAVLLVGYEWFQTAAPGDPRAHHDQGRGAAGDQGEAAISSSSISKRELDEAASCASPKNGPAWCAISATSSQRADLTEQELRTLHGIVHELVTWRRKEGRKDRIGLLSLTPRPSWP